MPKLIIDHREIEVSQGIKVIDAAEQLGIVIPRFCYHPALGAVGACRVCAVKFLEGPVKGIEMSCMVAAQDGMVVSTHDPEVVDFRSHVIEWLMINHPHDCPVCDEGGHCLLQDLTVAGGHGRRNYEGRKRTYPDQSLGPLIVHEMNRCIQCYRCVRYYQEYSGYLDLGVMGIAQRVYFGRSRSGNLESPFSGNLIDVCPTGVFTDKPSRYTGRRWEFLRTPGICIHCSLGCHTTVSVHQRGIVRQEARLCPEINGHFICDRGRYGFEYANAGERPRSSRIDGEPAAMDQAITTAGLKLNQVADNYGPEAVAVLGSGRSNLQTLAALKRLCRRKNWSAPVFFEHAQGADAVITAISFLTPDLRTNLADIQKADVILIIDADPVNEAPMLALSLRQAQRAGAIVFVLDPRPVELPFEFSHRPCRPDQIASIIDQLNQAPVVNPAGSNPTDQESFNILSQTLDQSRQPVLICGTDLADAETAGAVAKLARRLHESGKDAGLCYLLPQANSAGAVILSDAENGGPGSATGIIEAIESGKVKALLIVESDLWENYPDRGRLENALSGLEVLIVLDYLDTRLLQNAHIAIPTQSVFESGGIYVNQQGLAQRIRPAFGGGLSVRITGGGSHPPRHFTADIPGGDLKSAAATIWAMTGETPLTTEAELEAALFKDEKACVAFWRDCTATSLFLPVPGQQKVVGSEPDAPPHEGFQILPVNRVFGTEPMSCHSPWLTELEAEAACMVSAEDALALGIDENDRIKLLLAGHPLEMPIIIKPQTAGQVLILPRKKNVCWQQTDNIYRFWIEKSRIEVIKNR